MATKKHSAQGKIPENGLSSLEHVASETPASLGMDSHGPNQVPMGITHTEAVVKPAKSNQTVAEAMQSNQATYKPYTIFSALLRCLCHMAPRIRSHGPYISSGCLSKAD